MSLALVDLLMYENTQVVAYHSHHQQLPIPIVRQQFQDLLAWMWLNQYRLSQGKKSYFFGPLLKLDALWHSFILHSRDYVAFSAQFFGSYYHHDIEPLGHAHVLSEEALNDFLHDCFEQLGEQWVERCFAMAFEDTLESEIEN